MAATTATTSEPRGGSDRVGTTANDSSQPVHVDWEPMLGRLAGLPDGEGINIAYEAVDRHVDDGRGDEVAFRFITKRNQPDAAGESYSYQRLAIETNRFARALRSLGVWPSEAVFLLAGRVPRLYVAALGALKGQHVVCPLFSAFGPEPIRQRMMLGDAAVLVTTRALYRRKIESMRDELPARHYVLVDVDAQEDAPVGTLAYGDLVDAQPTNFRIMPTAPETPALLHFTSGTTGAPKGALHVHEAVAMHRATAEDVFGLQPDDVYWCTADPGWVTGTSYGIIGPLTVGATVVVDEAEFDAARWYRLLEAQRVNVWYTAPTAIRMLMRAGPKAVGDADLSSVERAFSVGEPLSAEAVRWGVDHLGLTFRDSWWQTETGAIMIANSFDTDVQPGSMGRPVCGIEAGLLRTDANGDLVRDPEGHAIEIVDADEIGMIALRAGWPSMFRTYLSNEERYLQCFTDGWYLAGDLARRSGDGRFWFVGRADDVIKTAGHLIGPFEVESVLNEHPDVTGSGVYGVPDPVAGDVIHARVVLRRGIAPTEDTIASIVAHARRRLGAAVAPRQIEAVDQLPITRSGKVMRRLLRARELGLPEGDLSTLERPDR